MYRDYVWTQMKDEALASLRDPVGQMALVGGTLLVAFGLAAFNSPVLAEGCKATRVASFTDIRTAQISVGGTPVNGSIVDVVATSRGGVARYVLAYEAGTSDEAANAHEPDGAGYLRTVSLQPGKVAFCDTGKTLRAEIGFSKERLDSMRELTTGSAVNAALAGSANRYGPVEMSLTALSMWHDEQGEKRLTLKLFEVHNGVRVGAIVDDENTATPVPLWEVARPAYSPDSAGNRAADRTPLTI